MALVGTRSAAPVAEGVKLMGVAVRRMARVEGVREGRRGVKVANVLHGG